MMTSPVRTVGGLPPHVRLQRLRGTRCRAEYAIDPVYTAAPLPPTRLTRRRPMSLHDMHFPNEAL